MSHLRLFIIYISCISGSWYLITPNLMSYIIQNTYIIICSWWWYAKKTHIHPKDEISTYNGTNVMMLYLLVQCDVRYISHNITVIMVTQWYVYSLMCVVCCVQRKFCRLWIQVQVQFVPNDGGGIFIYTMRLHFILNKCKCLDKIGTK